MTQSALGSVRIVEVGPRDGLQNEQQIVPLEAKVAFVDALGGAGLREIEITSFVSPDRVPQLADAAELITRMRKAEGVRYPVLLPNLRGYERWAEVAGLLPANARAIAFFTAASEAFNQKNIGASIDESLARFGAVMARLVSDAGTSRPWVRGYVSTAFRCPYSGPVPAESVRVVVERLLELGVDEVALSDTIGAATPSEVRQLLDHVAPVAGMDRLALHLHDTRGTALANVLAGLEMGISVFDASAGGLGGCPFAPGASGNLATEDLVYMLNGMGVSTGVDLASVVAASTLIGPHIGHGLPSRELSAFRAAGF